MMIKTFCRSVLLALAPLFFSSACTSEEKPKKEGGIELAGKVQNPQAGYIYLEKVGLERVERIDSTKADDQGNFSFQLQLTSPGFFILNFYDVQQQELVLHNTNVQVEADGKERTGLFKVTGSKDTDYLQAYRQLEKRYKAASDSLQMLMMEGKLDRTQATELYKQFTTRMGAEAKQFIEQGEPSLVAILATSLLETEKEIEFLKDLQAKLQKAYPESEYVKYFSNQVQQLSQTAIGQPAPDIALRNPEGQEIKLSSLRGKYVLIDFWASWCGPCRRENPNVVRMYKKFKDKGFEIYGVSLDKDREAWLQAIKDDGLGWTHVSDLQFWNSAVVPMYRIEGIPMTVLLDKNGTIIDKNLRGQALEDRLTELLM